jgi:SpoIID/LytB domain protein
LRQSFVLNRLKVGREVYIKLLVIYGRHTCVLNNLLGGHLVTALGIRIGKELEIRRVLSETHLFSSAFVVEKMFSPNPRIHQFVSDDSEEPTKEVLIPDGFILHGAGWGHGVGLCQIGAAVMGERGYSYDDILLHYYVGAQLDKKY